MEGKVGDRMSAADCVSVSGGVQFHGPQWNCLRLCLSFALFARSLAIPLTKRQRQRARQCHLAWETRQDSTLGGEPENIFVELL